MLILRASTPALGNDLEDPTINVALQWNDKAVSAISATSTPPTVAARALVYAIDRSGRAIGRLFLKRALGAAYTPLTIGGAGRIYTQNDGTLFMLGER